MSGFESVIVPILASGAQAAVGAATRPDTPSTPMSPPTPVQRPPSPILQQLLSQSQGQFQQNPMQNLQILTQLLRGPGG